MKIIMLSPFSARSAGMNRLYQLAVNMKDDVEFILPRQDKYGVSPDNPHFYFPAERKSFLSVLQYAINAFSHIRYQKPDVLYFYKPHPFTFPPVFLYKLFNRNCITVLDCDEWEPATLKDNDEPIYKQLSMELLSRFCLWFADRIVYSNEYIKTEKIPPKYWRKSLYLPNGVDTNKFKPSKLKKHKGFNIFLVSYLYKIKHILSVVDTVDRVRGEVPDLVCHIIGDGPRRGELEAIVRERKLERHFRFHGVIPYEKIQEVLSSADAIIVPYSNLPGMHYQSNVKIFEFMSLGKPIIASDVGELRKYLEDGKAGYVVESDNVAELSNALLSAYKNKSEALKKAAYARKISVEKNDWKFHAEKLEKFLRERT